MSEEIYQAEDRASPLNQVHQKNIDKWLNGDESFKHIILYELYCLQNSEKKKAIEESKEPIVAQCLDCGKYMTQKESDNHKCPKHGDR